MSRADMYFLIGIMTTLLEALIFLGVVIISIPANKPLCMVVAGLGLGIAVLLTQQWGLKGIYQS